jgi:hypothetical protein
MTRRPKHHRWTIAIEVFMTALVGLSMTILAIDIFGHPTPVQSFWMEHIDLTVACIFMTEFIVRFVTAPKPMHFFKGNWYLLAASIPITVPGTELFRLLRLERVLRIIRVFDHGVVASRH